MIYFSSLLREKPEYKPASDRLIAALDANSIPYCFLHGAKDIWLRDFMPVLCKKADALSSDMANRYVSFRYKPSYLKGYPGLRTNFRKDIAGQFDDFGPKLGTVLYSGINLDGGNVVLSPFGDKAIVSDRIFSENPRRDKAELIQELEGQLHAHVILIPSDPEDMTGHADGMAHFLDENTVVGNAVTSPDSLEQQVKEILAREGLAVVDFPYEPAQGISAVGCYLNYLETDSHVLLPIFGRSMDKDAIREARRLFRKDVIPVRIEEIAQDGGCLNCISWEC